ncbi:MAG: undecaprenyl-diphosphate phosphatase [Alphaproteobacteria bacterium]|nr:undecaprenyl-diphosphate phosphatase [Alphaproteobacteria bacterium]
MTLFQLAILALVQGITEFLPVSSSAHLILPSQVLGWPDQGIEIDIAVHVGTLLAVLIYFWRDVFGMIGGVGRALRGKRDPMARLALMVVLGTIPAVGAGYALKTYQVDMLFRSAEVIAWATIGFAILLYVCDKAGMTIRRIEHVGAVDAVVIGLAQCLAFIPGTSRSGITMTAARLLGFERADGAKFSMLLSIPLIAAAGLLAGKDLIEGGDSRLTLDALIAGGLAFLSAIVVIWGLMAWLRRASHTIFVVYRLLLGGALLVWIYL